MSRTILVIRFLLGVAMSLSFASVPDAISKKMPSRNHTIFLVFPVTYVTTYVTEASDGRTEELQHQRNQHCKL